MRLFRFRRTNVLTVPAVSFLSPAFLFPHKLRFVGNRNVLNGVTIAECMFPTRLSHEHHRPARIRLCRPPPLSSRFQIRNSLVYLF